MAVAEVKSDEIKQSARRFSCMLQLMSTSAETVKIISAALPSVLEEECKNGMQATRAYIEQLEAENRRMKMKLQEVKNNV